MLQVNARRFFSKFGSAHETPRSNGPSCINIQYSILNPIVRFSFQLGNDQWRLSYVRSMPTRASELPTPWGTYCAMYRTEMVGESVEVGVGWGATELLIECALVLLSLSHFGQILVWTAGRSTERLAVGLSERGHCHPLGRARSQKSRMPESFCAPHKPPSIFLR